MNQPNNLNPLYLTEFQIFRTVNKDGIIRNYRKASRLLRKKAQPYIDVEKRRALEFGISPKETKSRIRHDVRVAKDSIKHPVKK